MNNFKYTLGLFVYTLFKIPLIAFCFPRVLEFSDKRTVLKIPLGFRTRNHLNSMYFGVINVGAELCIAMTAVQKIKESGHRIDFLFKDYKVNFLKRADGDVHFICDEVGVVVDQIKEAGASTERINRTMRAYAIVPSQHPTEKVAEFELTLSVRRRVK